MKKISNLNLKKIIIFTLLVIGIILVSPIINSSVYAKTGKLPSKINEGLLSTIQDNVTKALFQSEEIYQSTAMYKHNDTYLKKNGYNVDSEIKISDEFWTNNIEKKQKFVGDEGYMEEATIPKGDGAAKLSANGNNLKKYMFEDLKTDADTYCAFKSISMLQDAVKLEETFDLKRGSELAKRLNHFIGARNSKFEGQSKLLVGGETFGTTSTTYLDNYGHSYSPSQGISASEMKTRFNYIYSGGASTYPYTIPTKISSGEVSQSNGRKYADYIVALAGKEQTLTFERGFNETDYNNYKSMFSDSTSFIFTSVFNKAVQDAIANELGNFQYKTIQNSNTALYESVADTVPLARTNSYYEYIETLELSPQAAFALAGTQVL